MRLRAWREPSCKLHELRLSSEIKPARNFRFEADHFSMRSQADLPLMQPTNFEFVTCQDHGSST